MMTGSDIEPKQKMGLKFFSESVSPFLGRHSLKVSKMNSTMLSKIAWVFSLSLFPKSAKNCQKYAKSPFVGKLLQELENFLALCFEYSFYH